jgi:hypothetical protein
MRHRSLVVLVVALLSVGAGAQVAAARDATPSPIRRAYPGRQIEVHARKSLLKPAPILASGANSTASQALLGPPTADIQVTYNGFTAQARAAFEAAVQIWETKIVSSQVIHVSATWTALGNGVLGSAGPSKVLLLNDNFVYPAALAEAVCSCEAPNTPFEINASFSSAFSNWYLGTDGNAPAGTFDLMTVVMHELGHGLGFLSSFGVAGNQGYWGYSAVGSPTLFALRYDVREFGLASAGNPFTATYPNGAGGYSALKVELTDTSVYFGGPNVVATLGSRAKLYAPNTWSGGSSNSHFDEAAFPTGTQNALMTPFLDDGEVIHDPGPLTLALFRDIGWQTWVEPEDVDPPTASAPRAEFVAEQTIGTTVRVRVTWPAAIDASGIASYQLQYKRNTGAWTSVTLSSPTQTSADLTVAHGNNYEFRVAATDTHGNTSTFATSAVRKLVRSQENGLAIAYSGSWKRVTLTGASGGYVKRSLTAGNTATYTFSGNSVAFVSTRGPNRGFAELRLDGALVATIDLYSPAVSAKRLVWASGALTATTHTLQIRVKGTKNAASTGVRVDVDALLAWQ